MSRLSLAALVSVIALSAIALTDAITHGLTGTYSVFADGGPLPVVAMIGGLVHAACYALLVAVLFSVASPLFARRPWRNVLRWGLAAAYGAMAVGMVVTAFGMTPTGVLEIVINLGFFAMLLLPAALGITLLIQRDRSPSAWLLTLSLLGIVAMFVLPEAWAHPAYAETFAAVGLALLGSSRTSAAAPSAAATAVSPARGSSFANRSPLAHP